MTDVSRNTVAVLLLLVILVAGFGTWSVLSQSKQVAPSGSNPAVVDLKVQPLPKANAVLDLSVGATHG